jgi:Arc/MetJ-type ribon-helix-helix transcriptional regulator
MAKLKVSTLRLPEEVDRKLDMAVKNGKTATKIEIIRRAIDEFLEKHPEMFT